MKLQHKCTVGKEGLELAVVKHGGCRELTTGGGYECVVVLAGQGVVEMNHAWTHRQANPRSLFSNIWGYIVRRAQLLIYGWQEAQPCQRL